MIQKFNIKRVITHFYLINHQFYQKKTFYLLIFFIFAPQVLNKMAPGDIMPKIQLIL